MTTTNPDSKIMTATDRMLAASTQRFARAIPQPGDFAPLDRKADTSRNAQRGTPKTRKRRFIL